MKNIRIEDETELTKNIVCNERVYEVPKDVAEENEEIFIIW